MIDWVDFKSIKRGVALESVLRHYHVELRRSGKDQYRGCCPIHRGDGQDAFHVNLARNVFHCFSCGAGGTVLDFVAAMEGCSLFDAAQRLRAMACSSTPLTLTPNGKELVTERRKVSSPLNFKLTGIDCTHPYLVERGISEKTAVEFGVGFYAGPGLMHGRLVIPIHNAEGGLIAYCGRSVNQTQPRYRIPPGFAKSEILFNMHRASCGRGQLRRRGGGFLRLHESASSRLSFGRRANGIGSLRAPASTPFWRDSAISPSCWTATRPAARRAPSSPKSYDHTAMYEWYCYRMASSRTSWGRRTSGKLLQPPANDD